MFSFGSGVLQGFRNDISNSTPVNFGLIQEATFDWSFDTKSAYGQYQMPVAIGRAKGKLSLKAKAVQVSGLAFGNFFFGSTPAAGQVATAFAETGTIPGTPYQITVSNTATFVDDLGVVSATTGIPYAKVASAPTTGQYSVSAAGVYTFAAADTTLTVLISYTYTISATGEKIVYTNQLMGTTPTFQANLYTTFQSKAMTLKIPNCVCSKLGFGTKLDDFTMPDFEADIFADAAGNVATWSFGEKS